MADKGMPTPSWFVGSWQAYTNPTFASLEANTDLILRIFQFFNLDPRVHNLQPLYDHAEEGELHEEAEGGEPGGKELGEPNEENLEDIPLVFKVPVNANEDVLAMQTEKNLILTQNDDNTNQEREEPDSLNLVLESATLDDCWSFTFLQQTKLVPKKLCLLFAVLGCRKLDPFTFPKFFTISSA